MITKTNSAFLLCFLVFSILSVSCSDFTEGTPIAKEALAEFHRNYNQKKFERIYENTHKDFKNATPEDDFVQLLETINAKLGSQVSTKNTGWNVNSHNFKTYVSLGHETTFSKGKGNESFTYLIQDKQAKLIKYNINSLDLILK